MTAFDWRNPDYRHIWRRRLERLARMRERPELLGAAKIYYREHIAQFIDDWGVTVDPRNAGTSRPVIMPFILFPRQREFIDWLVESWRTQQDGVEVKSRDCGASWLAMGFAVSVCDLFEDVSFGFGSAKEDKVDRSGDPDSLFYKGRMFQNYLPREFRPGWEIQKNSAHMRLLFPHTGSSITGEAGDNIGRGGRKTMYFVDEFAFVERPRLVDASLSATTNCRIEMSSVNGTANVFAERARGGKIRRFDFHYRDDPRYVNQETKELYPDFQERKDKADPVVWASERECDFLASVEGIVIPQEWVQAAIGAAQKLGIAITGRRHGAFDVADQGKDKNCYGSQHGIELQFIQSWSGKGSDIFDSVERAFCLADDRGDDGYDYDADGMGAGVRGDARKISERRKEQRLRIVRVAPFRGSGPVADPELRPPGTERKNKDFFENYKAQCWWALRQRFLLTWRAVSGVDKSYDPSSLISISPTLPELTKTCAELSQPVWGISKSGKMLIDKTPDDVASPNNGDTVMMLNAYSRPAIIIHPEVMSLYAGTQETER